MLTQKVQRGQYLITVFIGINFHIIIVYRVGGEQTDHRFRLQPFFTDDFIHHRFGIIKQFSGFFAFFRIVENFRVTSFEFPGKKERCPVDVFADLCQRIIIKHFHAAECRCAYVAVVPVDHCLIGAGILQTGPVGFLPTSGVVNPHLFVFLAQFLHIAGFILFRNQFLCHPYRTGRILNPDGGAIVILFNLHRGVRLGRSRATDHQRQIHFQALHFFCHVHHFIQRRGDQTTQANQVNIFLFGLFQNFCRGHHHAHIDDFEVIALQHHADNVFTNVVHIAFYRGH